jgi:hypothetical protein
MLLPPQFSKESAAMLAGGSSSGGASGFARERLASAVREDVGNKRMRESFAPEPSPLLASDRRNAAADGATFSFFSCSPPPPFLRPLGRP